MVSKLYKFSTRKRKVNGKTVTIPKGRWKGPGMYYRRSSKQGGWTKYSASKDKKRGGKTGSGKLKHTHDRKAKKSTKKRITKKRKKKTTKKRKKKKR